MRKGHVARRVNKHQCDVTYATSSKAEAWWGWWGPLGGRHAWQVLSLRA